MRQNALDSLTRARQTFGTLSLFQRIVAAVGVGALLLASVMVYQWATAPRMAPLFSNVSAEDASAIVEALEADGTPYELTNGGNTIMVPENQVYDARIRLSGEGLPSASDGGYSILDEGGMSTSEFEQRTDFKRAMEGELANTIEAIDGIETAIVRLAIPEEEVFTSEQEPTTASVLVETRGDIDSTGVQSILNLVSGSVEGLKQDNISISDANGDVLHSPGSSDFGASAEQDQKVVAFQERMTNQVEEMLNRVVGPGNSTVTVTPVLNFDQASEETVRYFGEPLPISEAISEETLEGSDGQTGRGILGPEGQMELDPNATGDSGNYSSNESTTDYGTNRTVESRQAAPGQVESLHVGILLDSESLNGTDPGTIENSIAAAIGIQEERGDTLSVEPVTFDRTTEEQAAADLAEAKAEDAAAARMSLIKQIAIAAGIALVIGFLFFRMRRRAAQNPRPSLRVEQIPTPLPVQPAPAATALPSQASPALPTAAAVALEASSVEDPSPIATKSQSREQVAGIIDSKPDEAADLLRGWLVGNR